MTEQPVEALEAPDGSLLLTRQTFIDACYTIATRFRTAWPLMDGDLRERTASMALMKAMGFPFEDAVPEMRRLRENPYFVLASQVLAETYEEFRQEGLI